MKSPLLLNQALVFFAAAVGLSSCIGSAADGDVPEDAGGRADILGGVAGDGGGPPTGILRNIKAGSADGDGGVMDLVDAGIGDGGAPAPPACNCDDEPLPEVDGDGYDLPHCNAGLTAMVVAAVVCSGGVCIPTTRETPCPSECDMGSVFLGVPPKCR